MLAGRAARLYRRGAALVVYMSPKWFGLQCGSKSSEVVDGALSLAVCARNAVLAQGPSSQLESEQQGVASRGVGT